MAEYIDPHTANILTRNHIIDVSRKIHVLAHEMAEFAGRTGPDYLKTMAIEISQIGWNALFAARSIDEIRGQSCRRSEVPLDAQLQQIGQQVDALFTAARYLEISVEDLKKWGKELPEEERKNVSSLLLDLSNRLSEVENVCKS
jgi:hypothetical protein